MSIIGRASGFFGASSGGVSWVWNPSDNAGGTLSNGNTTYAYTTYTTSNVRGTVGKSSGKWYWEIKLDNANTSAAMWFGAWPISRSITTYIYSTTGVTRFYPADPYIGHTFGFAMDCSAGTIAIYRQNSLVTTLTGLPLTSELWHPVVGDDNTGAAATVTINKTLVYAPPSGFSVL